MDEKKIASENSARVGDFLALQKKVNSGKATVEETADYMRRRDLSGLPDFGVYLKESKYTAEWMCPTCGGPIPCSIDCPQCGHARPISNADPEQEGVMGRLREKARTR